MSRRRSKAREVLFSIGLLLFLTALQGADTGDISLARAEASASASEGYALLSFEQLSGYTWKEPVKSEKGMVSSIPPSVKQLNGHNVSILGFQIPLDVKDGVCTSFALCRTRAACCYGVTPALNEIILCEVRPGKSCTVVRDIPMKVSGTLQVGEQYDKGELMCIYRMDTDSVQEP